MADVQPNADIAAMSFEQALDQLEKIVDDLERGDVPLEQSIRIYERGEVKARALLRRRHPNAILVRSNSSNTPETPMTQTNNRFFDEAARLMNDAAGVAQGVRREFDTLIRTQAERILADLDVVRRDEFEAVKEMARLAREENEALKARIAALEAKSGSPSQG